MTERWGDIASAARSVLPEGVDWTSFDSGSIARVACLLCLRQRVVLIPLARDGVSLRHPTRVLSCGKSMMLCAERVEKGKKQLKGSKGYGSQQRWAGKHSTREGETDIAKRAELELDVVDTGESGKDRSVSACKGTNDPRQTSSTT